MGTGTIENNKAMLKKLFRDAFFVACLMELIHSAASLTDSYFGGNYTGSLGLAAMGLARPFFSFVDIVCGPLGLGTQLVCSHYIGKCDMEHAQKTFSGSLSLGLIVSLLLSAWGITHARVIVDLLGTGSGAEQVAPLAQGYLRGLFIGAPAIISFGVLAPVVQLSGGKKALTESVFLQFAVDVIGDAVSVLVLDSGMFGLGLATSLSYYASLIPLLLYFCRKKAIFDLRLSGLPISDLKNVLRAGSSKAIKRVCNTVKPIILNTLSLVLGTALALSAYSITNQVRDFLISFNAGVAVSVVLIGALLYNQRDRSGLECLTEIAIKAIISIAVLGGLCIIFSNAIAGFFISDSAEVLAMAALSIRCVGLMIPFSAFNGIVISFMQITKRFGTVRVLSYLNRLILIVVFSALLGLLFGTNGLWVALPVSEIVNAIISLLAVRRINGRFPRKISDLLCLPDDFGYKAEDYIEITLNNVDDVAALQNSVEEFCKKHNIDSRRSFFMQLALEELTMNVIEHGFPECRYKPMMHVWVTYDKGALHLRIQDNCPSFNAMKFCSELQQASPMRCVGLRLVSKISKEINYINSLDTNNLMITI